MLPGKLAAAVAGLALVIAAMIPWTAAQSASSHVVNIREFAYDPQELAISAGDTVTWTNRDTDQSTGGHGHTATADNGEWNTGSLRQNESKALTFNSTGTWTYSCLVHPGMKGTLRVNLPPGVTTTSTTRPPPTTRPPTTTTVKPTTTTRPTTTTTTSTTTTTAPPPPTTERAITTTSTSTTTSSTTTTTERLELSSGDADDDGGGGNFVTPLLLGLLFVVGGSAAAAVIVSRLRGGGG